jgi:hypothetical protein
MKNLCILLIVLAICLTAYGQTGHLLVYKAAISGTSAKLEADPNGWLLGGASETCYLIAEVADNDPNILLDVRYIHYSTDKDSNNRPIKEYDFWTAGGDFSQTILPGRPPKGKNIAAVNIVLENSDSSVQVAGLALGAASLTDIGTMTDTNTPKKTKVNNVAASLKGFCRFVSGINLGDLGEVLNEQGGGTLIATLDAKWTQTANNPDLTKGFDRNIDSFLDPNSGPPSGPQGLLNWFISKGYVPETF